MISIRNYFPYSRGYYSCIAVLVLCVSIAGCAADRSVTERPASYAASQKAFTTIAVVPFQKMTTDEPSVHYVRCPVSGSIMRTCAYTGAPEQKVEEIFTRRLRGIESVLTVPPERVQGAYRKLASDSFVTSPLQIARSMGTELNVDGVILGYLFCYRDRKGYTYSVEYPASAAFSVYLIDVKSGAIAWKGIFDKTQASLMENVLDISSFIRQGGQWVTADELIEEGVLEMMESFPGARRSVSAPAEGI